MLEPLLHLSLAFILSLGLGLYLTPRIRDGALRFGVVDQPDGNLKTHARPVAYLGGIAIYLAFLITLALVFEFSPRLLGLLLGGTMVVMLGLFDDLKALGPGLKFIGQALAVGVLIKSGIGIHLVAIPTWAALGLTVLWTVGITNAVNIIDVSDGLAAGTAAISAIGLGIIAVLNGDLLIATTTFTLVGALVGFLKYNQAPASIYLGDAGSLFIGFMLAALAAIGAYTGRTPWGMLAPLFLLALPILDTALVSLARLRRGHSPFRGSPDHFALRLKQRGWSSRKVALWAAGVQTLACAMGIGLVVVPAPVAMGLVITGAVGAAGLLAWWASLGYGPSPDPVTEAASSP